MPLQLRCVGHGEAGAVDDPDPVPEPSRGLGGGSHGGGGALDEPVVDGQGESLGGLAVGGVREGPAAEVDHMPAGGVAVEDLEQEEVEGSRRVQEPPPPAMLRLMARLFDARAGQTGGNILAQSVEDGDNAWRHGGDSVQRLWVLDTPTECAELLSCSRRDNS